MLTFIPGDTVYIPPAAYQDRAHRWGFTFLVEHVMPWRAPTGWLWVRGRRVTQDGEFAESRTLLVPPALCEPRPAPDPEAMVGPPVGFTRIQ